MIKNFYLIFCLLSFCLITSNVSCASSMFDDNGNYSGNWKQMTNVSSSSSKYNSSNYASSAWYTSNRKQQIQKKNDSYSNENYSQTSTVPFRYNTLNYTKIRKVKGGYGDYNAHCSDIGDVSFCH